MRTRPGRMPFVSLVALVITLTGCGAVRTSPDQPVATAGLTPSIEDKDAGLVAMAPGFDVKQYKAIVVERFPVAAGQIEDANEQRLADKLTTELQQQFVRRLEESGLFQPVVAGNGTAAAPTGPPTLVLHGVISRFGIGDRAARYFGGIYGAGKARVQADMRLAEVPSGRVVLATADRRVSHSFQFFGGDTEDILTEGFKDMARDFAKFLVRLSKGEAPTK